MKVTRTTLRLPSKSVQYGYVEVDVEHDGDWEALGRYYYGVVKGFQKGEADAKSGQSSAKMDDVLPPPTYEEPITERMVYAALSDDAPEDVQAAAEQMLVEMTYDPRDPEGPGITTLEEAEALIKSELGATNITDVMNEDVEEETPEWEKPPPPPSDDDWDF